MLCSIVDERPLDMAELAFQVPFLDAQLGLKALVEFRFLVSSVRAKPGAPRGHHLQ